jgi:hypothetical protein
VADGTASKADENLAEIVVHISRRVAPRIARPTYATRNHHVTTIDQSRECPPQTALILRRRHSRAQIGEAQALTASTKTVGAFSGLGRWVSAASGKAALWASYPGGSSRLAPLVMKRDGL